MKKWLKNLISYVNTENTKNIIIVIICIEAIFFLTPKFLSNFQPATVFVSTLGDLTNNERTTHDLPTLNINPLLTKAAQMKANDMAENSYFAHTSPSGKAPWYWLRQVGYIYNYAGENLAINFANTEDVTAAWMNSPAHQANIEKAAYTEMGSAIATGTYEGKETIFIVQLYGNPIVPEIQNRKTEELATATTSGEVLGTSTNNAATDTSKVISQIDEQKLTQPIIPEINPTIDALLILLGILIFILLLNSIVEFRGTYHIAIRNILFIMIVIILTWLINIHFLGKDMITNGFDYSKEQVNRL